MEVGTEESLEKSLGQGKHLAFLSFKGMGGSFTLCGLVWDDKEYGVSQMAGMSKFEAIETTSQGSQSLPGRELQRCGL